MKTGKLELRFEDGVAPTIKVDGVDVAGACYKLEFEAGVGQPPVVTLHCYTESIAADLTAKINLLMTSLHDLQEAEPNVVWNTTSEPDFTAEHVARLVNSAFGGAVVERVTVDRPNGMRRMVIEGRELLRGEAK